MKMGLFTRDFVKTSRMCRDVFILLRSTYVVALLVNLMENFTNFKRFSLKEAPLWLAPVIEPSGQELKANRQIYFIFSFRQASGFSLHLRCLQNVVSRPASLLFVYRSIIFYPFPLINSDVCKQRSMPKLHD